MLKPPSALEEGRIGVAPAEGVSGESVATMERDGITQLLSFDRHFDRIPGIERIEP